MVSSTPPKRNIGGGGGGDGGGGGPCIRFEGIKLELSSFSGCQFDFSKDGDLVLSLDRFSGAVTLKSADKYPHAHTVSHAPAHDNPLCSTCLLYTSDAADE